MLQQLLGALFGAIASALAGALKDMRGKAAFRQLGAQDVYLRQQEVENAVRKRAAEIDRSPMPNAMSGVLDRL